jgi:uncharacterized protein YoxC
MGITLEELDAAIKALSESVTELEEKCAALVDTVEMLEFESAESEVGSINELAEAVRTMAQRIASNDGVALADVFYYSPTRKS